MLEIFLGLNTLAFNPLKTSSEYIYTQAGVYGRCMLKENQMLMLCHFVPQVMSVVRHALQPTISDITAEWILPPGMELIQTPSAHHHHPISRGEPIVIYALLCDTARLQSTLASVLLRGDSIKRTNPFVDPCLSRGSSTEKTEESSMGTNASHANTGSPLKVAKPNIDRGRSTDP